MTDGSINAVIMNWIIKYEGVLGYLTIFKNIFIHECGEGKRVFHWEKGERKICVSLRDM